MNTFEVGKWYRYTGNAPASWRGGQRGTGIRKRVADRKPRLCIAVDETGDWCLFKDFPPNVNHPEGLWDWTENIEMWQKVSVTAIDDLIVYHCPTCGKLPKIDTEVVYTKKYRSVDMDSKTIRTYSCCDFMVSGPYPKVLDAWNSMIGRYLENKQIIVEMHNILKKMLKRNNKYPKELSDMRSKINKFLNRQYGDIDG